MRKETGADYPGRVGARGLQGFTIACPAFFKGAGDPPQRNLYDETSGELNAKLDLQPRLLAAESLYRPAYAGLDLQDLQSLLEGVPGGSREQQYTETEHVPAVYRSARMGDPGFSTANRGAQPQILVTPEYDKPVLRSRSVNVPAQRGLLDLLENDVFPSSDRITAGSLSRQREAEISDVEKLGPRATQAFRAANPEQQALLDRLNKEAQAELDQGASLDPSMAREVQQSVRAGQSARGMGLGLSDLAQEGYFTGLQAEQLRRARQTFAQGVVGINQATSIDPFMATLGRPSINLQQGNGLLGSSLSLNRSAGPQLFGSSVNANDVFDSNFNATNAANISNANNSAAMTSAGIGAGASIAGAGIFAAVL